MLDILKQILSSDAGSFAFVASILGLAFWVAVKSGTVIEKYRLIDKMESGLDKIKDDLAVIKAFIEVAQIKNDLFSQNNSPINLNEKGLKTSEDLNLDSAITISWGKISNEISNILGNNTKSNPYTIQEACFEVGKNYSKYFDDNSMDNIKTFAFNEGYNLGAFDVMIGIKVRNKYFVANKIKVSEIDEHDPTVKSS